jgi:hypothetical protein
MTTLNELDEWENKACGEGWHDVIIRSLVSEVRRLQHQLDDPNYLYAGSRIHRQALIVRDAEADRLREIVAKLKAEMATPSGVGVLSGSRTTP